MSEAHPVPDPRRPPSLIVVTGYPGTGKTSLARHLSVALRIPMIAKDAIKEKLFDVLGTGDEAWSHLLGRASMAVLYDQVASLLCIGNSVIAEANFDAELGKRDLRKVLEEWPADVVRVVLTGDADALVERFRERASSGERHPGHLDDVVIDSLTQMLHVPYEPPDLPGPIVEVDVTDLDAVDFDAVAARVAELIGAS